MNKNIFLSKNRRFITTKKRGRKSKRGKRGKNSKWNKRGKRVKTVNTNMRKNRTKKGRRNIQKGGVWVEVTQKKGEGNETYWYDLNKNGEDDDFYLKADYIKDPARTWRKYTDTTIRRDYYANDSKSVWDNLPPPNPDFEPGYVSQSPSYAYQTHTVAPQPVPAQQPVPQLQQHKLVPPSHNTNPAQELSDISALLFNSQIESDTSKKEVLLMLHNLHKFNTEKQKFDIYNYSFHSNGKNQTLLYAACRTPYVSLDILEWLTNTFECSPGVKTSDGFYPLGALIASLHDKITSGVFLDRTLVAKYIKAIAILIKVKVSSKTTDLIKNKNKFGLTAYDDFAQLLLYNFIRDCDQLTEICKLLLIDDNDFKRKNTTVLFEACSQDNIYPDLIRRLIECVNNVNEKSIVKMPSDDKIYGSEDREESGYPINALIRSYERIKSAGGDVTHCKAAIGIVFQASHMYMQKIDSEYSGTFNEALRILST